MPLVHKHTHCSCCCIPELPELALMIQPCTLHPYLLVWDRYWAIVVLIQGWLGEMAPQLLQEQLLLLCEGRS